MYILHHSRVFFNKKGANIAKDDMEIIIYKILQYLYEHLKNGKDIDQKDIRNDTLNIPYRYWACIIKGLAEKGYVERIECFMKKDGPEVYIREDAGITLDGYLFMKGHKTMREAEEFLVWYCWSRV